MSRRNRVAKAKMPANVAARQDGIGPALQGFAGMAEARTRGDMMGPDSPFIPMDYSGGPGVPVPPNVPEGTPPKAFIYRPFVNLTRDVRPPELTPFATLRGIASTLDLVGAAIYLRQNRVRATPFRWIAKDPEQAKNPSVLAAIAEADAFWQIPDRLRGIRFDQWSASIVEEVLVTDAPTIDIRRNLGGGVHSFVQVDGSYIKPYVDSYGYRPEPPYPAYCQIQPDGTRAEYTAEELIYRPMNVRANSNFGRSPVEVILGRLVVGVRRLARDVSRYNEGSIPSVFIELPEGANPETYQLWMQVLNDYLRGNDREQMSLVPLPPGASPKEVKPITWSVEEDRWIARIVCTAFGISPALFEQTTNRATAEELSQLADDAGQRAIEDYLASLVEECERIRSGSDLITFEWEHDRSSISKDRWEVLRGFVDTGLFRHGEVRSMLGGEPDEEIDALPLGALQNTQAGPAAFEAGPSMALPPAATGIEAGTEQTGAIAPASVLNGAQTSAVVDVVARTAAGQIPRGSAVQIVALALNVPEETADRIIGDAGKNVPTVANPTPDAMPAEPEAAPAGPPDPDALSLAAKSELSTWERYARKHGVTKAQTFRCTATPEDYQKAVRDALVDAKEDTDPALVVKAAVYRAATARRRDKFRGPIEEAAAAYLKLRREKEMAKLLIEFEQGKAASGVAGE